MYDNQNFDDFNNNFDDYSSNDWGQSNQLKKLIDSAFIKGLISAILCSMPIGSIVSIFLGAAANKAIKQADAMARRMGTKAGGKRIPAKILAMVGMITGIAMSCFWVFYILYFIVIIAIAAAGSSGGYYYY